MMLATKDLDKKLQTLQAKKLTWAQLPINQKIDLLQQVLDETYKVRHQQAKLSAQNKNIPSSSHLVGEEWLSGPVIQCRTLRLTIETLKLIQTGKLKSQNFKSTQVSPKQLAVDVFPTSRYDKIMFDGVRGQVWLKPGVTQASFKKNIARDLYHPPKKGGVSLVLGAGNVASIGPLDVLQKIMEGKVVILKLNPVNEYLGKFFEQSFKPLIDKGFVQVAYGGADVGEYLCQHQSVEDIHITGSDKTHDIICYGLGEKGQLAKKTNKPRLNKTITSELGNVSPIIIAPGKWTRSELKFHAENVATQLANNAGFNCLAARVLVLPDSWKQKSQFMRYLGEAFDKLDVRDAYYPGAKDRYQRFTKPHLATVKQYGKNKDKQGALPWTVIEDLAPNSDSICFKEESFCSVMAQTSIKANSTKQYLEKAVEFCNQKLWGTLSCTLIIDPKTQRKHKKSFNKAVHDLKYGAIGVNQWHALSYALGSTTWGAFPGHSWQDIQSGQGNVHNTYMIQDVEKSVVHGPFTTTFLMPFKPIWFVGNKSMLSVAKALCDMEYQPKFFNFLKLVSVTVFGFFKHALYEGFASIKKKIAPTDLRAAPTTKKVPPKFTDKLMGRAVSQTDLSVGAKKTRPKQPTSFTPKMR